MTALVTEHLPLVAGAPEGIKRLRELVLSLAIQGRLLNQSPDDEPAEALLLRLSEDRQQKVRSKLIRAAKPMAPASVDDLGSPLPSGWVPVRLGEIGDWGAGATPARSNSAYYGGKMPWFKSGELTSDLIDCSEESVTDLALKECSLRLNQPGDVLIAMYGATIGKTAILAVPATTNQAVCACTPFKGVFNGYLLLVLKALRSQFVGQGAGGAQPNISKEKIVATTIGLPPEPEQHRIVAKVDELMALCDRLEADQADAEAAHAQLVQALLGSLTQATDAADFRAHWQRLSEHFHTLFTTEASIDALKQTVLQLAVMGKLVPQTADDEHASILLQRAQSVKKRMVAEGRVRKDRSTSSDATGELPFAVPPGWAWAKKSDVLSFLNGYAFKSEWFRPNGVRLLRNINVGHGVLDWHEAVCVPDELAADFAAFSLSAGDLVLTLDRPIISTGLKVAVLGPTDLPCLLLQRVAKISSYAGVVSTSYLSLWLNSAFFIGEIDPGRSNGVPHISTTQVGAMLIALPPLAEQHRIVAKVDELMALCDQLKAQLAEARQQHAQLATALIEQAVA